MLKRDSIHQTIKSIDLYPLEKIRKVIGPMKDELGEKIMKEFVALGPKMYSYLADDGPVGKKAKSTKRCVIKRELKFADCKNCLENNKIVMKSQQRSRREEHNVFTRKVSKTAFIVNDGKRLQTLDGVTTSLWLWFLKWYAKQNCWNI